MKKMFYAVMAVAILVGLVSAFTKPPVGRSSIEYWVNQLPYGEVFVDLNGTPVGMSPDETHFRIQFDTDVYINGTLTAATTVYTGSNYSDLTITNSTATYMVITQGKITNEVVTYSTTTVSKITTANVTTGNITTGNITTGNITTAVIGTVSDETVTNSTTSVAVITKLKVPSPTFANMGIGTDTPVAGQTLKVFASSISWGN